MSENSYDKKYYLTYNNERYVKVSYAQANIEDLQQKLKKQKKNLAKITDIVSDATELGEIDVLKIYRLSAPKAWEMEKSFEKRG